MAVLELFSPFVCCAQVIRFAAKLFEDFAP